MFCIRYNEHKIHIFQSLRWRLLQHCLMKRQRHAHGVVGDDVWVTRDAESHEKNKPELTPCDGVMLIYRTA